MDFSQFEEQLKPVLKESGFHLLELKMGGDDVIRAVIHKEPAFTHKDCGEAAGLIHDWAETVPGGNVFSENMLEVSSPGLTRTLLNSMEAQVFKGRQVRVNLRKEIDGKKEYTGTIVDAAEDFLLLEQDSSEEMRISSEHIRRIKLSM